MAQNDDVTQLALVTGSSVLVNTIYQVQKGKDPVVTLVAGGFLFVGLSLFGGLTGRMDLSKALAWVFFLASLLFRGVSLFQTSDKIVANAHGNPKTDAKTSNNTTGSAPAGPPPTVNPNTRRYATPGTGNVVG